MAANAHTCRLREEVVLSRTASLFDDVASIPEPLHAASVSSAARELLRIAVRTKVPQVTGVVIAIVPVHVIQNDR